MTICEKETVYNSEIYVEMPNHHSNLLHFWIDEIRNALLQRAQIHNPFDVFGNGHEEKKLKENNKDTQF